MKLALLLLTLTLASPVQANDECSRHFEPWEAAKFLFKPNFQTREGSTLWQRTAELVRYYARLPYVWGHQYYTLWKGLAQVHDLIRRNPLPGNLIPPGHPWLTGLNPRTGQPIWPENVIFASTPKVGDFTDETILQILGGFMISMVEQSVQEVEIPLGPRRRMPHAINYIHGSSHYNSGFVIFNDIEEAFAHLSDPRFREEVLRFIRQAKREVLIVLRDRAYDVQEYAFLVLFVRSIMPFFSNSDGPQMPPVLWGNPAPFAVINIITGEWAKDVFALKDPARIESLARVPIASHLYFNDGPYAGIRTTGSTLAERLLGLYSYYRVKLRGRKGNHSTLDRREVDPPGGNRHVISHILRPYIND